MKFASETLISEANKNKHLSIWDEENKIWKCGVCKKTDWYQSVEYLDPVTIDKDGVIEFDGDYRDQEYVGPRIDNRIFCLNCSSNFLPPAEPVNISIFNIDNETGLFCDSLLMDNIYRVVGFTVNNKRMLGESLTGYGEVVDFRNDSKIYEIKCVNFNEIPNGKYFVDPHEIRNVLIKENDEVYLVNILNMELTKHDLGSVLDSDIFYTV